MGSFSQTCGLWWWHKLWSLWNIWQCDLTNRWRLFEKGLPCDLHHLCCQAELSLPLSLLRHTILSPHTAMAMNSTIPFALCYITDSQTIGKSIFSFCGFCKASCSRRELTKEAIYFLIVLNRVNCSPLRKTFNENGMQWETWVKRKT